MSDRLAVPRWMVSADRAEMSPRCGILRACALE
jgi:hypothetical protein